MRRTAVWIIAITLLASPVAAGKSGGKCTLSTQACLDQMAHRMKNAGWVGVELDLNDATGLWVVTKVLEGSPAATAGIEVGDVLYALDGIIIRDENEKALEKARKEWKPGQLVHYTIKRNGADRQMALTLAPMPADVLARYIGQHLLEHATIESSEVTRN